MDKNFKIVFDDTNVQDSVAYILVSEFDLKPNVLKAEIDGDGSGVMILSLVGDEDKLDRAADRLREVGFEVTEMVKRISRDEKLCWNCGACVSICPVGSFFHDKDTWEVCVDNKKCISCGACVNACSAHALSLHI